MNAKTSVFVNYVEAIMLIYLALHNLHDCTFNKKTFENANLISTEPWALANEIMLNIIQNFKFYILEK